MLTYCALYMRVSNWPKCCRPQDHKTTRCTLDTTEACSMHVQSALQNCHS
jgi:hypothetical protein